MNTDDFSYQYYPSADNNIRILYIDRILKGKGINELLEAIKYIKSRYPYLQFDIVGFCDVNYEGILQDFDKKGLLKFHGQQNNVVPYIENVMQLYTHHIMKGLVGLVLKLKTHKV